MGKRTALAMALSVMIWGTSHAGWFDDAVKGALEGAGKRAVDETVDGTYQGAKGKAKEAGKDGPRARMRMQTLLPKGSRRPGNRLRGPLRPRPGTRRAARTSPPWSRSTASTTSSPATR